MVLNSIIKKITNRKIRKMFDKAVADIKRGKRITDEELTSLEDENNGTINVTDSGIEILSFEKTIHIDWSNVDKIVSFKRDLWTTDQACLGFIDNTNDSMVVVHEEMSGFLNLRREIEAKNPGFEKRYHNWLFSTPAFDGNHFTLLDIRG